MWNRLLSQIVEQSGGTVTNKDNRCKLLQDWLDSVDVGEPVPTYWLSNGEELYSNDERVISYG